MTSLSISFPAYNEADNIGAAIEDAVRVVHFQKVLGRIRRQLHLNLAAVAQGVKQRQRVLQKRPACKLLQAL